ncbi:MAG: DUF2062 domain-containing protein [Deltaproteobacteria bacterium]|nr:DUF2062 domain-containing protein [Deltaproteobacteria bacterium]
MIFKSQLRKFYERFISLKGEPKPIAAGLAMGIFVGITPTIPFHTALIIVLGLLFKQNMTAAYFGSWLISNPVTIPILYFSQYQLGRHLLGMAPCRFELADYSLRSIFHMGGQFLLPLLTGGMVMAFLVALPAYFISRRLIVAIRAKRER